MTAAQVADKLLSAEHADVLRQSVAKRTSFTFMGSEDPRATERLGTIGRMHSVMAALLAEIEKGGMVCPPWPPYCTPTLGVGKLTIPRLLHILHELAQYCSCGARRKRRIHHQKLHIVVQIDRPVQLRFDFGVQHASHLPGCWVFAGLRELMQDV